MHYRLRPLRPGQFALFSLFVFMTVAAIVFGIFRLPIPLFVKIPLLSGLCTAFLLWRFWEVSIPNRVIGGRLATIGALGMALLISSLVWANHISHGGGFGFSSMEVLAGISLLFIMTGHLIPKAIIAIHDRIRMNR